MRHALVSSVCEDHLQAWDFSEQSLKQVRQALTVRIVCRSDQHAEQKAQCIGNHVSFSAFDLLAGVTASAQAALAAGWNRLAVDDRGTGRGSPAFGHASGPSDPVHQLLKQVLSLPLSEVVVDSLPRRKSYRKHAPLKATLDQMKHRIQKLAWMVLHELEAIKNRFDPFPFCVGQVGGIPRGHRSESVL